MLIVSVAFQKQYVAKKGSGEKGVLVQVTLLLMISFGLLHIFYNCCTFLFRKEVEAKHRAVQDKKERVRNALASNRLITNFSQCSSDFIVMKS